MIRLRLWTDSLRWDRIRSHYRSADKCDERISEINRQIEALEAERDRLERTYYSHRSRAFRLRETVRSAA